MNSHRLATVYLYFGIRHLQVVYHYHNRLLVRLLGSFHNVSSLLRMHHLLQVSLIRMSVTAICVGGVYDLAQIFGIHLCSQSSRFCLSGLSEIRL